MSQLFEVKSDLFQGGRENGLKLKVLALQLAIAHYFLIKLFVNL